MNVRGVVGRGARGSGCGERRDGAGLGGESSYGDESFLCMVVAFRGIREKMGDTHPKLSHSLVLVDYGVPLTFSLGF